MNIIRYVLYSSNKTQNYLMYLHNPCNGQVWSFLHILNLHVLGLAGSTTHPQKNTIFDTNQQVETNLKTQRLWKEKI